MRALIIHSDSEAASLKLGRHIGECLEAGDVLALWGELGAGRTLLTRGVARGLGISPEVRIASPTFTFINEYEGRLHLYHIDLYRVADAAELDTIPWREVLFGSGVAVVEWPERLGAGLIGYLPAVELVGRNHSMSQLLNDPFHLTDKNWCGCGTSATSAARESPPSTPPRW